VVLCVYGCHEQRARRATRHTGKEKRRGRSHAVLSGSGFGHDTLFSEPYGQKRLAQRVVDFVRAGVIQILALQINLRAAVSAWPSSSNAITITAAPYLWHSRACSKKLSVPSFNEIELTTALP